MVHSNETLDLRIIFEDIDLVVIDKPAGMIVNDAKTTGNKLTVQEWFKSKIESGNPDTEFGSKGGVVHRLDKDTSGLLVLAKTEKAYENLKAQFLERKVVKKYAALVHGEFKEQQGIISLPIERHPMIWGKFAIGTDLSRTAITEWKALERYTKYDIRYTMMELMPMTGRTHQLRVHMKHIEHPIAADPIYLNKRQLEADLVWCPRLFLHAKYLEFDHPESGKRSVFESDLPKDLSDTLVV